MTERRFRREFGALQSIVEFVNEFLAARGVDSEHAYDVHLIIEELFTNTVRHGYGEECDRPIHIALAVEDGTALLLYEDAAPPHDPLEGLTTVPGSLTAPLESRPIGGLGMYLVGVLAENALYAYEEGRNSTWRARATHRCGAGST